MFELFEKTSLACSKITTTTYSTSFSIGIKLIRKDYRWAIYGIYGFVRLADEIVDTFERNDKQELLAQFKHDTYQAIERGISLNPILQTFQKVANTYGIGRELIEPFFSSMESDLSKSTYDKSQYDSYIHGSAEVVGMMCLKVFCDGNDNHCETLREEAMALGSAFQKVNFLRDMKSDLEDRGRIYFPELDLSGFNENAKLAIIQDVRNDFKKALQGIKKLPISCRFGVYTSYIYYLKLLDKIERTHAKHILQSRIRVADSEKIALLAKSFFRYKLNAF
jgi:15-cis-phytoene synthase